MPSPHLLAHPSGPLTGTVFTPGDKSISHRSLILGAMAEGETAITGLLQSEDVLCTAAAVRALGAHVERRGDSWHVKGGPWTPPDRLIDCGNSGTAARLLMGAIAGRPIAATVTGDASLRSRPMGRVTEPLRQMGARISGDERLPLTVTGGGIGPVSYVSPVASAQVKSAVLLAGLGTHDAVDLWEPLPSRDHTERMLPLFGVEVETGPSGGGYRAALGENRRLRAAELRVPGDPSSAAFPLVAALLVPGSSIALPGILANPLRTGLIDTLVEMGADLRLDRVREQDGEPVANLMAGYSLLRGVTVPAERAPSMIDEYPILAVAAALADGETLMHGLSELRVKESDRLQAIVRGLRACGVDAHIVGDTLIVRGCGGPPPGGAQVETHGDHRIAMAFLVLGLAAHAPVGIDRPEMIATSFPGFAPLMTQLGARIGGVA